MSEAFKAKDHCETVKKAFSPMITMERKYLMHILYHFETVSDILKINQSARTLSDFLPVKCFLHLKLIFPNLTTSAMISLITTEAPSTTSTRNYFSKLPHLYCNDCTLNVSPKPFFNLFLHLYYSVSKFRNPFFETPCK